MLVYLARHGRTQWNAEGRKQGRLDSPLTDAGKQHAIDLARLAATLDIDLVASSPIGRALATAMPSAEALGLEVQVIPELAEVDHGDMSGLTTDEVNDRFPGALDRRSADRYGWRFPAGESYADADERAGVALAQIAATGARRPLIVSHEMIGRMLLRNLLGWQPADALATGQPHNTVYRVDPTSGSYDKLVTQTAGGRR